MSTRSEPLAPPVPTPASTVCYAFGGIVSTIKVTFFGMFTLFFYTTVRGVPGTWVGMVSAVGLVWDALIDPFFGNVSDRSSHPFGRRHIYMLISVLLLAVSMWMYFAPPAALPPAWLFGWLLFSTLLVRTAVSAFDVPYLALGGEISADYQGRTAIFGARAAVSLVGAVATIALVFLLFFPEVDASNDPKMNAEAYPRMGLFLGGVMTASALIAVVGTLSWRQAVGAVHGHGSSPTAEARRSIVAVAIRCLRIASVRVVMVSFGLFFLAVVLNRSLSLHFLTYCAELTASQWVSGMQTAFFLGSLVGVPFWMVTARRFEKRTLYVTGAGLTALLMLLATLAIGEGRWLGTGHPHLLMIGQAFGGFFSSILWFIPHSMVADVVDEVEYQTGMRPEGAVYGLLSLFQQLAAGMAAVLGGALLDHYAEIVPGQSEQTLESAARISMLHGAVPAAILSAACLVIGGYRLNRGRLAEIQQALSRRATEEHRPGI